jgi:signal transduction histidine kinase
MSFFRNPEVKRYTVFLFGISIFCIVIGFCMSTSAGILTASVCAVFSVASLVFTRGRYKKIAEISRKIDRALHGEEYFVQEDFNEGELAILHSELQKLVVRLREQTEAVTAEKVRLSESIADISHQLRTPMTTINLIISFLQEPALEADKRFEYARELSLCASRIDGLVTSLLKMARIDAGTVEFKKKKILVADVVTRAVSPFAVLLDLKRQQLLTDCGSASYEGDLFWSAEAVGNLVKNCIEHTPEEGVISVTASENALFTEIVIKDNGSGFCEEDLPHLFERFYRGKNAAEDSIGIGLALARAIISGQNGTIKACNAPEGGAMFIIRLYKGVI